MKMAQNMFHMHSVVTLWPFKVTYTHIPVYQVYMI
jgi:hypothetical protein